MGSSKGRLVLAVVSTILEEAALVAIVLWGLPELGISIPVAGLVVLMVALVTVAVISYRMGSRALKRQPVVGLPEMVGSSGKVASSLAPRGLISIKGELWEAESAEGIIETGDGVTVVGQDGLRLRVVKKSLVSKG